MTSTRTRRSSKVAAVDTIDTIDAGTVDTGTVETVDAAVARKAAGADKRRATIAAKALAAQEEADALAAQEEAAARSQKYSWGAHTREAGYAFLTVEAKKLGAGLPGVRGIRLSRSVVAVLDTMIETGKWHDGSRKLKASERTSAQDMSAQYAAGVSWKVRGVENGFKSARADESTRRMLLTIHAERSQARRGASGIVVDVDAAWSGLASKSA